MNAAGRIQLSSPQDKIITSIFLVFAALTAVNESELESEVFIWSYFRLRRHLLAVAEATWAWTTALVFTDDKIN